MAIKIGSSKIKEWQRPVDWLPMPTITSEHDIFVGLHAIFEKGNNYVAFRFTTNTGQYRVDWGDGSSPTLHNSNTIFCCCIMKFFISLFSFIKCSSNLLITAFSFELFEISITLLFCSLMFSFSPIHFFLCFHNPVLSLNSFSHFSQMCSFESFVNFKINPDAIEYNLVQGTDKTIIQSIIFDKAKIATLQKNLTLLGLTVEHYRPVSAAISNINLTATDSCKH
jgi:hypothetical protein